LASLYLGAGKEAEAHTILGDMIARLQGGPSVGGNMVSEEELAAYR
jgi:hypothetical protein